MNQSNPSSDERIRGLEERITFQQQAFEDLHQVALRHQRQLEAVERELARLKSALGRLSDLAQGDLPHEKPPHY